MEIVFFFVIVAVLAVVQSALLKDKENAWVAWVLFLIATPILGIIVALLLPKRERKVVGDIYTYVPGSKSEDPMAKWEREQEASEIVGRAKWERGRLKKNVVRK